MTQDEIIRMAQACGFSREDHHAIYDMLTRFAELVSAAAKAEERASCAAVCDDTLAKHYTQQTIPAIDESLLLAACADCAAAIRARGNT